MTVSGQFHATLSQQSRKRVVEKIRVFARAQIGKRIEPCELGVDAARMTHDKAAVGQAVEKFGKEFGVIGARAKAVSAGEGRIGPSARLRRELPETPAQSVEDQPFRF